MSEKNETPKKQRRTVARTPISTSGSSRRTPSRSTLSSTRTPSSTRSRTILTPASTLPTPQTSSSSSNTPRMSSRRLASSLKSVANADDKTAANNTNGVDLTEKKQVHCSTVVKTRRKKTYTDPSSSTSSSKQPQQPSVILDPVATPKKNPSKNTSSSSSSLINRTEVVSRSTNRQRSYLTNIKRLVKKTIKDSNVVEVDEEVSVNFSQNAELIEETTNQILILQSLIKSNLEDIQMEGLAGCCKNICQNLLSGKLQYLKFRYYYNKSIAIQSQWRGLMARQILKHLKETLKESAITIQSEFRSHILQFNMYQMTKCITKVKETYHGDKVMAHHINIMHGIRGVCSDASSCSRMKNDIYKWNMELASIIDLESLLNSKNSLHLKLQYFNHTCALQSICSENNSQLCLHSLTDNILRNIQSPSRLIIQYNEYHNELTKLKYFESHLQTSIYQNYIWNPTNIHIKILQSIIKQQQQEYTGRNLIGQFFFQRNVAAELCNAYQKSCLQQLCFQNTQHTVSYLQNVTRHFYEFERTKSDICLRHYFAYRIQLEFRKYRAQKLQNASLAIQSIYWRDHHLKSYKLLGNMVGSIRKLYDCKNQMIKYDYESRLLAAVILCQALIRRKLAISHYLKLKQEHAKKLNEKENSLSKLSNYFSNAVHYFFGSSKENDVETSTGPSKEQIIATKRKIEQISSENDDDDVFTKYDSEFRLLEQVDQVIGARETSINHGETGKKKRRLNEEIEKKQRELLEIQQSKQIYQELKSKKEEELGLMLKESNETSFPSIYPSPPKFTTSPIYKKQFLQSKTNPQVLPQQIPNLNQISNQELNQTPKKAPSKQIPSKQIPSKQVPLMQKQLIQTPSKQMPSIQTPSKETKVIKLFDDDDVNSSDDDDDDEFSISFTATPAKKKPLTKLEVKTPTSMRDSPRFEDRSRINVFSGLFSPTKKPTVLGKRPLDIGRDENSISERIRNRTQTPMKPNDNGAKRRKVFVPPPDFSTPRKNAENSHSQHLSRPSPYSKNILQTPKRNISWKDGYESQFASVLDEFDSGSSFLLEQDNIKNHTPSSHKPSNSRPILKANQSESHPFQMFRGLPPKSTNK